MALIQQSYLLHLLNECDAYSTRQQKQAIQAVSNRLKQIYSILKRNIRQTFTNFSLDVIVRFTQISVQLQEKLPYAEQFVDLFFQRIQAPSQFYIRQLLVKAKVIALKGHKNKQKGQQILKTLKQSISYIIKALDLISGPTESAPVKGKDSKGGNNDSSKTKYGFLVYNASTCLYKITRFILRNTWQKNFADIFQRIYKLFQQIDQPDHSWRCSFSLILFQCLYDSDKRPDAFKVLDSLWQRTKNKHCDFQDSLFRLRVHLSKQNNALAVIIKKDIQTNPTLQWGVLQILQKMKSGTILQAQIQKQLMNVVNTIHDGILSNNQQTSTILSPIKQQRLAQAGRIALKYNIISIASSITSFLSKARQPNQKAMVLNEYNKAQLLIKKKGEFIDKKTGMMMSTQQIKSLQIQYRKQALKILQKVMIINKKMQNPQLIYEGSILIWNISLPFMCPQFKSSIIKPFQISVLLLQQIDSIDHDLRTKMHLQLAKSYFGNQSMFLEVQSHIMKAIKLDHSIALNKIQYKFQTSEDISLYQRPYERYLEDFRQKILLKTMQNIDPDPLDIVTQDLWNVSQQKSQTTRLDILQKCLKNLLSYQQPQFKINQEQMLVEQQIKQRKLQFQRKKLRQYKRKKNLTAEVAQFAFQWDLNDFSKKACQFVLTDTWQPKNALELIIAQSKCCYFMAQIKIDELINHNFQLAFDKAQRINQQQNQLPVSEQKQKQVNLKKQQIFSYLKKGLQLAQSINQHWLVFNGSIYIWNNCLHIFRNPSNDPNLKPQLITILQIFFQSMKKSLNQIQNNNIVYYDLDNKIQIYANIGLVFARLRQLQKKNDEVLKICQSLLTTSLSPHTRKLINGVKARVQKNGGKAPVDNKKAGKQPIKKSNTNDTFLLDIITQLQIIQNTTNKNQTQNLIKKCFQNLQTWKPKQQDQTQIQLHTQLWVRLARLALNQSSITMYKYSLRCCQYSLNYFDKKNDLSIIPVNRLRWYSLADFLYSQGLMRICNPDVQQPASVQKLRFAALTKAIQSVQKVLDGSKQVWNICTKLQATPVNRYKLMNPLKKTLGYLKQMKQDSQIDLILLLSQLYFKITLQNNQFKAGQQMADMLLNLVPKNLQKSLWQAKMIFMSKQGKNQLHAISSMKQADPSLQAKLWVKLARVSVQSSKKHTAYNKALQILKKQHSVQIVQVLIQYAQWQARIGHQNIQLVKSTLLLASDYLIDIQYGDYQQEDDPQQDKNTVFSRSTRGKKSIAQKSIKSNKKSMISKKNPDKKGPISTKSKASSGSRMDRSGRIAKTVKSKNTKSIFSDKQQDPNPQSLNCLHFERLFRIHTILAMITQNQQQKIRYALDAKQFITKMYDLAIRTLNQLLQNASKFAQKSQKKQNFKKIQIPSKDQDWIRLDLPKQFIDRINNFENYSFIGTYTFQKPQLTYTYLKNLLSIFEDFGLSHHSLPIIFFARYISKYILNNDLMYDLMNLKLKKTLQNMDQSLIQQFKFSISLQSFKISQNEQKKQIQKAQNSKVVEKNEKFLFQQTIPPSLVKPFSNYQIWIQIGYQLISIGQISIAKQFLSKAQIPAKLLNNNIQLSRIYKCLGQIKYYQGEYNECVNLSLQANKLCKNLKSWSQLIVTIFNSLMVMNKYQNTKKYITQVKQTIIQLIHQSKDISKDRPNFQGQVSNLKQTLLLTNILMCLQKVKQIIQDQASQQNINDMIKYLVQLKQFVNSMPQIRGKIIHFKHFLKLSKQIYKIFANGGGWNCIQLNFQIFNIIFQILLKVQKNILQINKYCYVGGKNSLNLINYIHRQFRYILIQGYQLKQILGQSNIHIDEQQIDNVEQLGLNNQILKRYMQTLKRQIYVKMSPVPTNLQPCQSSVTLLQNLKPSIKKGTYQQIKWFSYYTLSQTLRAINKDELTGIWNENQNIQQMSSQYGVLSLQTMSQFMDECEQKINNYVQDIQYYLNAQRGYLSLINNAGSQLPDKCFQFLSKYQHSCYTEYVIGILKQKIDVNHKYITGLRLFNNMNIQNLSQNIKQKYLTQNKLIDSYTKFPLFKECFSILPNKSLTIILQLSKSKTQIYFGCYYNTINKQECKYWMKKKKISKNELKLLISMKSTINKVKKSMQKTPFQNDKRISQITEQNQLQIQKMNKKFNQFNKFWSTQILQFINKPKLSNNQTQQQQINTKDNKKVPPAAKDQKKKPGGKDQLSAYQSPLGLSVGGIQSVTFLLDIFLYNLPYQHLDGLQSVPAVSKDTSLFYLSKKMQMLNYQPQINNSSGFGGDKGKFICFDFNDQSLNFSKISKQFPVYSNIKLTGINSSERIPAPGDIIQYVNSQGFLFVYGNISFLNRVNISTLLQSIGRSRNHLIVCFDNINFRKDKLKKQQQIKQESHSQTNLQLQEQTLITVLNLLNINMVKIRWNSSQQNVKDMINKVFKKLNQGYYIGNLLKNQYNQNKQKQLLKQFTLFVHGSPVLRI